MCSICFECVLLVFGGHCLVLAAERRLGFNHHVSALHPAAVSLSFSAHHSQQICNHSLTEQGVEMGQRGTWRRRRNHSTQEREQRRERDDCRRCQSKRRGQGSMQPAADRVGREGAGFLNTRRKKTKQVGRGLERAECRARAGYWS